MPERTGRFVCTRCGYVYDPDNGDPQSDVPAGTPFDRLPDEWVCPQCYAEHDAFDPESCECPP
jgi:rubredoxin